MARTRQIVRCLDHVERTHRTTHLVTSGNRPRIVDHDCRRRIIISSDEVLEAERKRPLHEHLMIMLALGTIAYFAGHGLAWLLRGIL